MPRPRFAARLGWFVALWLAGVLAVGTVGAILKLWIG